MSKQTDKVTKKELGNYNHLCRIPNTKENMDMIKALRKFMKSSESRWELVLRGRHPIEGKNYGYGGSLALKYAKSVSIYVEPRKSVKDAMARQQHKKWQKEWRNRNTLIEVFQILNTWNYKNAND